MKVCRNRVRVLIVVLCALAGVVMGTGLNEPLGLAIESALSPAAKASASTASLPAIAKGTLGLQVCPPATISGTLGSGSPDYPFVTGSQTSRLFRNIVESGCGPAKPFPGLTDDGIQFVFDAYSFTNTSASSVCINVTTTAGANNQVFTVAYLGSFNPANVQTNYLGDAGNSDRVRSFSFIVPGNNSFVVVQSRVNNAGNPPSLDYSFRVLGIPDCNTQCPPTAISGTIGAGSTDYPASSDTQSGKLFRNNLTPDCGSPKPVPSVEDPAIQFQYDAFTFLNTSASPVCITVNTTAGAANQILTAAYLDRFNPFDVQENYLGDAGNSNVSRSFFFTVPGNRSFVVVQSRVNDAGSPTSLAYTFGVEGLPCVNPCPPATITGTIGKGSADFPSTSGVQTGRTSNDGVVSSCAAPKTCPGIASAGVPFAFDSYQFVNDSSSAACVTFDFPESCGTSQAIKPVAYLGSFDPNNPCTNYLGDPGQSVNGNDSIVFSVNVPANSTVVLVVHELGPLAGCQGYSFSVTGLPCQASCPPATVINGTVGNGSPDFPATSGQQTGRITNGLGNLTCGSSNPCSLNTPTGSRAFDAYTFSNPGAATACVTVSFTMTGCALNQAIQFSARIGSFDPANPCTNYVGDAGAGFGGENSGSFSFNVPAGQSFVVVVNENDPAGATGCAYTLTISGITCDGGGQACTLTCPSNITQANDTNQCGAVVNFSTPTTSGDCGAVTCNPASGSFFPVGTTTVTCTEDSLSATCSFTVTINDTQPPSITCPANITASNDPNQCGAVINYQSPTVSDNCPNVGAPVCSPASGSFFPAGTTTVTCTVADASPNSPDSTCIFTITVNDTQPPVITCPDNVTAVTNQSLCPAPACQVVTFPPPVASDNCPGVTTVCNPASGSCFPVGVTTVTCTATDASGNTATCSFTVTTFDTALQDDSNPSNLLLWNSITGQYRFCCNGTTFIGVGKVARHGCVYTLQHNPADRRVLGRVDKGVNAGSASIQAPAGTLRCTIIDRSTLDDLLTSPCP